MTITIKCDGCGSFAALKPETFDTDNIKTCSISCVAPAPWGTKTISRELCRDCCARVAKEADPRTWARYEEAKE